MAGTGALLGDLDDDPGIGGSVASGKQQTGTDGASGGPNPNK